MLFLKMRCFTGDLTPPAESCCRGTLPEALGAEAHFPLTLVWRPTADRRPLLLLPRLLLGEVPYPLFYIPNFDSHGRIWVVADRGETS